MHIFTDIPMRQLKIRLFYITIFKISTDKKNLIIYYTICKIENIQLITPIILVR